MTVARFAAAEGAHSALPMQPWVFGAIALLAFAALLGVTWSFRGTAQKYARPDLEGTRHGRSTTGPDHVAEGDEPHWPEHPGHH